MEQIDGLSELSRTLFIPLAARAKETARDHPVVKDQKAVEIWNRCDVRDAVTDGGEISTHGILARTKMIDGEVQTLLARHQHAIVVNLGAGLDTRFFRLGNSMVRWYDLDLPEVISLRKKFVSENERLHFISKSVMDPSWVKEIQCSVGDAVILIAEGLLMYFSEEDVKNILRILEKAFPGADMLFDVVHPFFIGKKISSDFRWGVARTSDIERLSGVSIVRSWSTGDLLKERQSYSLRLLNVFPPTRNRSRIIHLKLKG